MFINMQSEYFMNTDNCSRTTAQSKNPADYLEQKIKLCNFSKKIIMAYLYYNKELLKFASTCQSNLEMSKKSQILTKII